MRCYRQSSVRPSVKSIRAYRTLFGSFVRRTIVQRWDLTAVAINDAPLAPHHALVLPAVGGFLAAVAHRGRSAIERKSKIIARRNHDTQLAVDKTNLAADLCAREALHEVIGAIVELENPRHATVPRDVIKSIHPYRRQAVLVELQIVHMTRRHG